MHVESRMQLNGKDSSVGGSGGDGGGGAVVLSIIRDHEAVDHLNSDREPDISYQYEQSNLQTDADIFGPLRWI
ncbi:Hypothetical predicted protein [Octopus vulgaris]|uniref:Uncharacterized protein n=1 Tax=Octopus vulgaris TaxID=6645 RepID=A0AA36EXZ7_OCTVU|nr:Hypothetical predicted protein [Octopus vulgaris]